MLPASQLGKACDYALGQWEKLMVYSRDGRLLAQIGEQRRVPVKLLAELMPGTVALPHGWGHQHATGLSVASRAGRTVTISKRSRAASAG